MTSTTTSPRRAALAAAIAAVLCAAPVVLSAQTATEQPPAGQPPMGGGPGVGGPGMGGRRGGPMQMLMQGITLSDAQRTRVDSLMTASRARMQAMRGMTQGGGSDASPGGPRPDSATRAARRQEMEAQRTALRNILTPDQQKTFDANVARMREMMQQRMGGAGGMGAGGGNAGPGRR